MGISGELAGMYIGICCCKGYSLDLGLLATH